MAAAPTDVKNFPVTIQNCDRTLTFDKPSTRVITYVSGLDTLIALGVQRQSHRRTHPYENLDDLPPGSKAAYMAIPEVAEGTQLPPKEPLLASGADFVIASSYTDYDGSGGQATREELGAAGIKSFIVGHNCTDQDIKAYKFQSTLDDVRDLGAVFGIPQRAEQVVRDLEARVADVTKRAENLKPLRVVTADPTEEAFYAPGSGTYAWVVSNAGGTNVFDGGDDGYGQVNIEEVAAAYAQACVIINYLPETAEQRIPCIVDGLEKVARVLHPEAFQRT